MKKVTIVWLVLVGLVLSSCVSDTRTNVAENFSSIEDFYSQPISWKKCGRFQCAELIVPINYQDLTAGVFRLAITKDPADQPENRIGSLVVNPGGPGGSGVDYAQGGFRTATTQILNRFDLIGFDPRGVGKSDPVSCLTDQEADEFLALDETPDNPAEIATWNDWVDRFAASCKAENPETWRHIGSWNVARDMDVLRAALGEPQLNWLGKSYGTLLGALYAQLFPDNVGRFVLDGAVDPDPEPDQVLIQIAGFETALNRFIADCLRRNNCPLTGNQTAAYQQLIDFLAELDRTPMPLSDGRELTESHAQTAILVGLYDDKDLWPFLRDALAQAFDGDGEFMILLSDLINNRDPDGKYLDNSLSALYAVNCVDYAQALTPRELPNEVARLSKVSRFFAPLFGWGSSACLSWLGQELEPVGKLNAKPINSVLIVGTTFDPATPPQWARSLSAQIQNSITVEWRGDGHTAYRRGSKCIDELIDSYLISGKLPATGRTCPAI